MAETVRVLRILEYVGPRSWIERTLTQGGVPAQGEHRIPMSPQMEAPGYIRSAIVGQYPELLAPSPLSEEPAAPASDLFKEAFEAADKYIALSPCDPDIKPGQAEAYKQYLDAKRKLGES